MPQPSYSEATPPTGCHSSTLHGSGGEPDARSIDDVVKLSPLELLTVEVAHDLGNLLQVASSAIRIIDRRLDGARRSGLDPVIVGALASIERATALSRRILDAGSRSAAGQSVIYLDTLLTELREEIALAAGPGLRLRYRFGDSIPAIVCHKADLENVLLNLVVNARDAIGGEGQITLSVERDLPRVRGLRQGVTLRVTDTGCGMPQWVIDQAFQPFFSTKPSDRGTGLGLALVTAFAARLGGSAELSSVVGKGTTVLLRLPSSGG